MSFGSYGARKSYTGAEIAQLNRHQRRKIAAANKLPLPKGAMQPHVNPKKNKKHTSLESHIAAGTRAEPTEVTPDVGEQTATS